MDMRQGMHDPYLFELGQLAGKVDIICDHMEKLDNGVDDIKKGMVDIIRRLDKQNGTVAELLHFREDHNKLHLKDTDTAETAEREKNSNSRIIKFELKRWRWNALLILGNSIFVIIITRWLNSI